MTKIRCEFQNWTGGSFSSMKYSGILEILSRVNEWIFHFTIKKCPSIDKNRLDFGKLEKFQGNDRPGGLLNNSGSQKVLNRYKFDRTNLSNRIGIFCKSWRIGTAISQWWLKLPIIWYSENFWVPAYLWNLVILQRFGI